MATGIYMGYTGSMPALPSGLITSANYSNYFRLAYGNSQPLDVNADGWWESGNYGEKITARYYSVTLVPLKPITVKIECECEVLKAGDKAQVTLYVNGEFDHHIMWRETVGKSTAEVTLTLPTNHDILIEFNKVYGSSYQCGITRARITVLSTTSTVSVTNKARKIKNAYIGVSGKARKVKRGYIGVGGKARLFFSNETIPKLSYLPIDTPNQINEIGASNSNYAIIFGGSSSSSSAYNNRYRSHCCYNKSLTTTSLNYDAYSRYWLGCDGASSTKYAFFTGTGRDIYTVDGSLTANAFSPTGATESQDLPLAIATLNDNLFAAGYTSSWKIDGNTLTQTMFTAPFGSYRPRCGTSVGNYALFMGNTNLEASSGSYLNYGQKGFSVTSELTTKTITAGLTNPNGNTRFYGYKYNISTPQNAFYLFSSYTTGNGGDGTLPPYLDVYNTSLTKVSGVVAPDPPGGQRGVSFRPANVRLGSNALYIGGASNRQVAEFYNDSVTKRYAEFPSGYNLSVGASIGDYAIILGLDGSNNVARAYHLEEE